MPSFAKASQNAHPENRIVRYTVGAPNPGFLLSRTGPILTGQFWAMFNDAFTEQINPPSGAPRPDPDPATRTKRQALPGTLQGAAPWVIGSMFSGQMRNVVQCEFSRGIETRFSYGWSKTHGLLEYPYPHVSGSDKAAEALNRSRRQYFIIEISPAGIYAAPITFGMTCADCALVNEYIIAGAYALNLDAYYAQNPTGQVQRVMNASQIAPAYAEGSPWYGACGWAFSYSGLKAANVVARVDNSAGFTAYLTTLFTLTFTVTLPGEKTATIVRDGNVARVTCLNHGFDNDDIVAVQGAAQDEYNGAHVVQSATVDTFDYGINGTPTSPATGAIKIANLSNAGTVGAALATTQTGRVLFRRQGGSTLWVPTGTPGVWQGVAPIPGGNACSGPVHVFYDGETQRVTNWQYSISTVAAYQTVTPPGQPWGGNATGTHSLGVPAVVAVDQDVTCEYHYGSYIGAGSGEFSDEYTTETYGFNGATGQVIETFANRYNGRAQSVPGTERDLPPYQYSNFYTACGGGNYSGVFQLITTLVLITNTYRLLRDTKTGTSALVLLPEEREAVAHIRVSTLTETGLQASFTSEYRSRSRTTRVSGTGPFTPLDIPEWGWNGGVGSTPETPYTSATSEGQLTVVGTGGFAYSKGLAMTGGGNIASANISSFQSYIPGVKETAESNIYLFRGGLYYDEPALIPRDQKGNRVFNLDGDVQTQGGFEQLNGKLAIGFVGQV